MTSPLTDSAALRQLLNSSEDIEEVGAAAIALLDERDRLREALNAARFVAETWRDSYVEGIEKGQSQWGIGTHPLALVLAALDGETDPRQLGLHESADERFRAALAQSEEARP